MQHYEIVFLVHPEQGDQLSGMIKRYAEMVSESGGRVHRVEDWGRRTLAYAIQKVRKAYYVLMNVEISTEGLDSLREAFRYNDAVLRNLIIRREGAITDISPIEQAERERRKRRERERQSSRAPSAPEAEETAAEVAEETLEEAPLPDEET